MKLISFEGIINKIMFFYILSLYLFTYQTETTVYSNALAFLLVASIWANFLIKKRKLIFNSLLVLYLLFIAICLCSVYFALDQSIAITKVRTLILIFIVMLSLINYIDRYEKLRKIISYFVYSGFIASIYILITSDFSQITRFGSQIGNVNAVGMIIGVSATFCFYIIIREKKYLYFIHLSTMIPIILLTGSRKSLVFILMNVIIILFLLNRKSLKSVFKFIIITILLLIFAIYIIFNVPLFYEIIGKRMENMFSFIFGEGTKESSMNERSYMAIVGFEMFKNKPITGYGIDNYRVLFNSVPGGRFTYAHNNFIELMVGIGIIGMLIYYFTHVIVLKSLLNGSRKADETICYPFIAIITSYIILAPSLVYYDSKHFSFLLAIGSVLSRIVVENSRGSV